MNLVSEMGSGKGNSTRPASPTVGYDDLRGRAARERGQSARRRIAKGHPEKTSGRSYLQNAPLRATSSDGGLCRSAAIANALPTHIPRTRRRVAFACNRKTLLARCHLRHGILPARNCLNIEQLADSCSPELRKALAGMVLLLPVRAVAPRRRVRARCFISASIERLHSTNY